MVNKLFTSKNGWFNLTLPFDWEEYDDGVEATNCFFNRKSLAGYLRITPYRWTQFSARNADKAAEYICSELNDHKNGQKFKLGGFDCAHYHDEIMQGDEGLIIYYWVTGRKNDLFICSFTILKKLAGSKRILEELETVKKILASIQINAVE